MNPRQLMQKQAYNAGYDQRAENKPLYVPMIFDHRDYKSYFIAGYNEKSAELAAGLS